MPKARFITGPGVWIRIEAKVPTNTIVNAAADSSACTPAPFRIAPTSSATNARTMPNMLSRSTCCLNPRGARW